MKIIRQDLNIGFKKFCEENNLELVIVKREKESSHLYGGEYCASWLRCSIVMPSFTKSCIGEGATEIEAIKNYVEKIKGNTIQILSVNFADARELSVPSGLFFDLKEEDFK